MLRLVVKTNMGHCRILFKLSLKGKEEDNEKHCS
jgi:hypothetical protein